MEGGYTAKEFKKINDRLGDRKSKAIFKNRFMYSLTDDYSYIEDIIYSLDEVKWLLSEIENCIQQFNTNNIWIFGAGLYGHRIYKLLSKKYGIQGFIDNDESKYHVEEDIKICSLENVISGGGDEGIYIIATKFYKDIEYQLISSGIPCERIISFVKVWRKHVVQQYFAKDIVHNQENVKNVFIDCGCYNGGNVDSFIEWSHGEYERIIAFEPDERMYDICKEYIEKKYANTSVIKGAVGFHSGEVKFDSMRPTGSARVDSANGNCVTKLYSIDEILKGKKATFIKMDIEGSELNALKGAQLTIEKYRPILAICVYHKPEDIWEIADYILSLHKDYKLYLRHYSLEQTETVLYAI